LSLGSGYTMLEHVSVITIICCHGRPQTKGKWWEKACIFVAACRKQCQKLLLDPIGRMRTLWGRLFKVSVKLGQKAPTPWLVRSCWWIPLERWEHCGAIFSRFLWSSVKKPPPQHSRPPLPSSVLVYTNPLNTGVGKKGN